jgi:hypothetical protein
MRWLASFCVFFLSLSVGAADLPIKKFRTPVRMVGDQATVKLTLKQGIGQYVINAWLNPTALISVLDETQIREIGWRGESRDWLSVKLGVVTLPITRFAWGKSDLAYLPDYPNTCCVATIGSDILKQYDLHVTEKVGRFETTYAEWGPAKIPGKGQLTFSKVEVKWPLPKEPLFRFRFLAPDRDVILTTAYKNIPKGSKWISVNNKRTADLDRIFLERVLTGKLYQKLEMEFSKPNQTLKVEF